MVGDSPVKYPLKAIVRIRIPLLRPKDDASMADDEVVGMINIK